MASMASRVNSTFSSFYHQEKFLKHCNGKPTCLHDNFVQLALKVETLTAKSAGSVTVIILTNRRVKYLLIILLWKSKWARTNKMQRQTKKKNLKNDKPISNQQKITMMMKKSPKERLINRVQRVNSQFLRQAINAKEFCPLWRERRNCL